MLISYHLGLESDAKSVVSHHKSHDPSNSLKALAMWGRKKPQRPFNKVLKREGNQHGTEKSSLQCHKLKSEVCLENINPKSSVQQQQQQCEGNPSVGRRVTHFSKRDNTVY